MAAQELFIVSLELNPLECWDDESTASALRALAVRLHLTGISLRETAAALEQFGVTDHIKRCSSGFTVQQRPLQTR
jgi:putative transposase